MLASFLVNRVNIAISQKDIWHSNDKGSMWREEQKKKER
jgi:hypothetical protein